MYCLPRSLVCSSACLCARSFAIFTGLSVRSFVRSFTHSSAHLLVCAFVCSFIHSSLIHLSSCVRSFVCLPRSDLSTCVLFGSAGDTLLTCLLVCASVRSCARSFAHSLPACPLVCVS